MIVACEWCGQAIVRNPFGTWRRAKGGETDVVCAASDDGEHGPGEPWSPYDEPREAHDEHAHCHCVSDHRPPYLELERHHILPLYLGGPDVLENLVWVCNTTHSSVHELLRLMLKAGAEMTYRQAQDAETRPVARYAYDLALDGYRRWRVTQP